MQRRWLKYALRAGVALLSIVVVLALVRSVRRDGPAALAAWREADINAWWIAAAAACGLLGHLIYAHGWRRLLVDYGIPISFWQTARLFFVSNLGRYLPAGKAWQMSIVAIMAAEQRLPAAPLATSSLFQGALGGVTGILLLVATGDAILDLPTILFVAPIVGVIALIAFPLILPRIPRLRAVLVRRVPGIAAITVGTMWTLVWTSAVSWIAWGLSLYALALGVLPEPRASPLQYIAAWIAPFISGLIAFVAPAGLGVREELMRTMLTTSGLPAGDALIVVVLSRLGSTIIEVVPAVVILGFRRRKTAPAAARGQAS